MNYRLLFVISIILGSCSTLNAQRLGPDVKRDLPKTLYISGGIDSTYIKVAEYFSEEKRSFNLEYIAIEELQERVIDPDAVFVLPFKTVTLEGDFFSMAMVSGIEMAKEQKVDDDGLFLRDRNMPLIVEVRAQVDWIYSEMILLYISALEGLHKDGQGLNQGQVHESLEVFKQRRIARVLMTENSVFKPLRSELKFNSVLSQGHLYEGVLALLRGEDIFDGGTVVVTAYEFKKKKIVAAFNFNSGLCLYKESDLDLTNGHFLDRLAILTMFKFLMN